MKLGTLKKLSFRLVLDSLVFSVGVFKLRNSFSAFIKNNRRFDRLGDYFFAQKSSP